MEPANGQASTSWNADYKVAHVGLVSLTGSFRESLRDATPLAASARDGFPAIDALPYWAQWLTLVNISCEFKHCL